MPVLDPTPVRRGRAVPARPSSRRTAAGPLPVRGRSPVRGGADLGRGPALAMVAALVVAATAIRLAIPRGLWLDEAISVHQARLPIADLIQSLAQSDRHPPLHHLVLWATVRLLGDGDLAVRAPSLIAGVLVVPGLYALASELYDRRTGVVAALFGTVAPLLVWYAQEARMYAFVTLFAVLAVLGCARVLRRGGAGDWALYTLAAALLLWTHWFAALLVLCTQAAFAVGYVRSRRPGVAAWGVSGVVLAWQLVPLGVLAASQVHATGTGGGYAGAADVAGGESFYTVTANLSWLLGGFHPDRVTELLSAVWPLGMLASLLALGRRVRRPTALLLGCALGPTAALLALGAVRPGLFDVRYFIAAAPLAVVLMARLAVAWAPGRGRRAVLIGGVFAVLAVALADQQLDPANPRRYDYREALARVGREMRPGDVVLYEPPELRYVLEHYAPALAARPLDGALPTRREARRVIVLGSFLDQARYRRVVDRQVGALRYARRAQGRERLPGVSLWRFR